MKPIILISLLMVTLLTAGNPAPQLITNQIATAEISPLTAKTMFTMLPFYTGPSDLIMSPNLKGYTGCLVPNGLGAHTAPFKIENLGKIKSTVYLKGTSKNGNYTVTCQATVKQGIPVIFELIYGNYVYMVQRGSVTSRGSFFINQSDKATMQVFKDKVRIGPF